MSRPVQSPAGFKRLEQNARRLRLWFSSWIYEVAGPRYALYCFDTHVETKSAPNFRVLLAPEKSEAVVNQPL